MKKPTTIDEYISEFDGEQRIRLEKFREIIQALVPEATEKISYGIPTFDLNGNLVHFAAFKNHIGFYPGPSGIIPFSEELKNYKCAKGSIQFPMKEPLPENLIKEIVKFRKAENTRKNS